MEIVFKFVQDFDNPDRPCKPVAIMKELIESDSFDFASRAIYEEPPEGEPNGNCHIVATHIMANLIATGRSKGWVWVKGRRKGARLDGSDFVHSWLEFDGWAIDASNTPNIPIEDSAVKTILIMDSKSYRKILKLKVTSRRNDKLTRRWINKKQRQFNR
jgi:hypothetical protein